MSQDECTIVLDTLESEDSRMAAYYDRIIQEATTQKNKLTAQIQAAKQNNLTILGEVQKVMDTERERILDGRNKKPGTRQKRSIGEKKKQGRGKERERATHTPDKRERIEE